jgi:hypothetical protein
MELLDVFEEVGVVPVCDLHLDDLLNLLQLLLGQELLHHQALLPLTVPLTDKQKQPDCFSLCSTVLTRPILSDNSLIHILGFYRPVDLKGQSHEKYAEMRARGVSLGHH